MALAGLVVSALSLHPYPAPPSCRCGGGRCLRSWPGRGRRARASWTATASSCRCVQEKGWEAHTACILHRRWAGRAILSMPPTATALHDALQVHQGLHWVCAVIDLQNRKLVYYDSLKVRRLGSQVGLLMPSVLGALLCPPGGLRFPQAAVALRKCSWAIVLMLASRRAEADRKGLCYLRVFLQGEDRRCLQHLAEYLRDEYKIKRGEQVGMQGAGGGFRCTS